MRRVLRLPRAFKRLRKIGGVLDVAVFEEAGGEDDDVIAAIAASLPPGASFEGDRLRALGGRHVRERRFMGDWWDPDTGFLVERGEWRTRTGRTLQHPPLPSLIGDKIIGGSCFVPMPGEDASFAYAFFKPPYSLSAKPDEIQALFDDVRGFLLPPALDWSIKDWSSPALASVSDYFEAGVEWWGAFLWSIHIPAEHRLTVVMASTTD